MNVKNIFVLLVLVSTSISAQKEDYIWFYGDEPYDIVLPERATDTTRGASNIDFNFDPPKFYYDPDRYLDFTTTNSSICDKNGQILLYTNGMVINNRYHEHIADTINYGDEWERNNFEYNGIPIPVGMRNIQGAIILPSPESNKLFYSFYINKDRSNVFFNDFNISYATVDVSDSITEGRLIDKDVEILRDSLLGSMTAVRHGNGRDWWLIAPHRFGVEAFVFLIDPKGIHFHQRYNSGLLRLQPEGGIGQVYASPNGEWLSWYCGGVFTETGGKLVLSKFDRCSGTIYDSQDISVDLSNYRFGMGVCFSPNSQFLYMCNADFIYQYDLTHKNPLNTQKRVAIYNGFVYYFPFDINQSLPFRVNFCFMGLAPDGRIYVSPSTASNRMMSVIEYPNEYGEACNVNQHSILMPTGFFRGIPNFPHYRLGPMDGSVCDSLGLDNLPVAKYRYEADSNFHLRLRFTDLSYFEPTTWTWDFGDGSPRIKSPNPTHIFPSNGTYNVCLTVSNINGQNTFCRTITLGIKKGIDNNLDVTIFPNPTQDYFLLTIRDFVPEKGELRLFDISGKLLKIQKVYNGQNSVDLSQVVSGTYVWQVLDGKKKISEGKVIKI